MSKRKQRVYGKWSGRSRLQKKKKNFTLRSTGKQELPPGQTRWRNIVSVKLSSHEIQKGGGQILRTPFPQCASEKPGAVCRSQMKKFGFRRSSGPAPQDCLSPHSPLTFDGVSTSVPCVENCPGNCAVLELKSLDQLGFWSLAQPLLFELSLQAHERLASFWCLNEWHARRPQKCATALQNASKNPSRLAEPRRKKNKLRQTKIEGGSRRF